MEFVSSILLVFAGGGLGWFFKSLEFRRTTKLDAGDMLADLQEQLWEGGPGAAERHVAKLQTRLRAAGVPAVVTKAIAVTALRFVAHKQFAEGVGPNDEPGYFVVARATRDLGDATEAAHLWLFGWPRPLLRRKARVAMDFLLSWPEYQTYRGPYI